MRLRGDSMQPYSLTQEDALWLARAVDAEGPIQSQVAGILINGFCWARSRGFQGTLTKWVRAYAQPINPRWYEAGDLFLASLASKSEDEKREAIAKARKREKEHSTKLTFGAGTHAAVSAALNGRVLIPRNATDYAAPNVDSTNKGYTPLEPVPANRNRLWTRPGAEHWTGYLVDATDAWPWLVTLAVVGVVVWRGLA
jgi:hypothetical protein